MKVPKIWAPTPFRNALTMQPAGFASTFQARVIRTRFGSYFKLINLLCKTVDSICISLFYSTGEQISITLKAREKESGKCTLKFQANL